MATVDLKLVKSFWSGLIQALYALSLAASFLPNSNDGKAQQWIQQGLNAGIVRRETAGTVDGREEALSREGRCLSNDIHVIALAQISGARLLYSNDMALHKDFRNKRLIDKPRGKVYSTNQRKDFTSGHARLLNDRSLCRNR